MKELKKLLESELLSEEVKAELKKAVEALKTRLQEDVKADLETEYAKKFVTAKERLAEKMTTLIKEQVSEEIGELKEDIQHYKGLDITYATKLEDFKKEYSEKLSESFHSTVREQVSNELDELREDLLEVKQNKFGQKIFETFSEEFKMFGISVDEKALKEELERTKEFLTESEKAVADMKRETIMKGLLDNLSGTSREIMKTILENVETDKLQTRYDEAIDDVLKDKVKKDDDDEEDVDEEEGEDGKKKKKDKDGKTIKVNDDKEEDEVAERLRKLSGTKSN